MSVESNYKVAKELYAEYGIDTDAALKKLEEIPDGLLIKERRGNTNYYSINLEALEHFPTRE